MKKLIKFSFLFVLLIGLSGCGNSLVCTKDNETDELTFSGDSVTKYTATYTFESNEKAKEYSEYYTDDNIDVKVIGKKLIITVTDKELLDKQFKNTTKEQLKKQAESKGAKCN